MVNRFAPGTLSMAEYRRMPGAEYRALRDAALALIEAEKQQQGG